MWAMIERSVSGRSTGCCRTSRSPSRISSRIGVDEDCQRRADRLNQATCQAGTTYLGERRAGCQLAVAFDNALDPNERRDVGWVGRVEERPQAALEEYHDVQLFDPQQSCEIGRGDREEQYGTYRVRPNQDWPASQPVDPGTCEEADE